MAARAVSRPTRAGGGPAGAGRSFPVASSQWNLVGTLRSPSPRGRRHREVRTGCRLGRLRRARSSSRPRPRRADDLGMEAGAARRVTRAERWTGRAVVLGGLLVVVAALPPDSPPGVALPLLVEVVAVMVFLVAVSADPGSARCGGGCGRRRLLVPRPGVRGPAEPPSGVAVPRLGRSPLPRGVRTGNRRAGDPDPRRHPRRRPRRPSTRRSSPSRCSATPCSSSCRPQIPRGRRPPSSA